MYTADTHANCGCDEGMPAYPTILDFKFHLLALGILFRRQDIRPKVLGIMIGLDTCQPSDMLRR